MDDDIITIKEVADYLKLKEKTAYALVARGEIPGFKVGGSWRFRKSEIEKWISQQSKIKKDA
jgi:excisionase family DNA binding protein